MEHEYPERVRLDADDVYRWSYDRKAGQDLQPVKTVVIVMGLLSALLIGVTLYATSREGAAMDRWSALGIMAGVLAAVWIMLILVFTFLNRRRGGIYHYRFEVDPEGVTVLTDEKDAEIVRGMADIVGASGIAAGHPVRGALSAASMEAGAAGGRMAFHSVRKVVVNPKKDYILLKSITGECPVYVPREDFGKMTKFFLDHVDDSVTVIDR